MTSKTHWIGQTLAMVLQALNLASGVVPAKYQPFIAFGIGIVQAGMGLYSHYYNPDGTPASVAFVAKVLLLMLLFGGTAMAQDSPMFSVSTQAVALRIGGQTVPGTDMIGSYNLTPRLQLQSDNILAPANNYQGYFGGVKYQFSWLDKTLAKTSLSSIKPYLHAALGIVRNVPATGADHQHYGALAGAGFDYQMNGILSCGPRVEYLNSPGFGPGPHGVAVSANLTIILAKSK